jgi:hypothetical protein
MTVGDGYRKCAADCVWLAQKIQDSADKALLLEMAEAWRRLAERAEAREAESNKGFS